MNRTRNRRNTALLVGFAFMVCLVIAALTMPSPSTTTRLADRYDLASEHNAYNVYTVRSGEPPAVQRPVVALFLDPMSPESAQFMSDQHAKIVKMLDKDKIVVEYHMVNTMDPYSDTGDYSSRVIGAMSAIAMTNTDGKTLVNFTEWVFAHQPPAGLSLADQHIIDAMRSVESGNQAVNSFAETPIWKQIIMNDTERTKEEVYQLTGAINTPVVTIDRAVVDYNDKDWLNHAVGD